MAVKTYKLGDLIQLSNERNFAGKYGIDFVRGISNMKTIMPTKADVDERVITKFYVVQPNDFIYNPRTTRMGDKVGLGFNDTGLPLLFSFNNIAFRIKETAKSIILPRYLYMYYNRNAFDRYAITNSWGSATELFTFEEMCDIDIALPDLWIQQKYVQIYESLEANQKSYEQGLEDLKLVCDACIEDLRRKTPCEKIGNYLVCTDRKTSVFDLKIKGISKKRILIDSDCRTDGVQKEKYLRIDPREFGYSPIHINEGSIAFNDSESSYLLSPIYKTFKVVDEKKLHPEYLMIWFLRDEFRRYCWFHAFGSARDSFEWDKLCDVQIPIPDIMVQKSIADIYKVYTERKRINEQLKQQIKDICPVLIKGSLEE